MRLFDIFLIWDFSCLIFSFYLIIWVLLLPRPVCQILTLNPFHDHSFFHILLPTILAPNGWEWNGLRAHWRPTFYDQFTPSLFRSQLVGSQNGWESNIQKRLVVIELSTHFTLNLSTDSWEPNGWFKSPFKIL